MSDLKHVDDPGVATAAKAAPVELEPYLHFPGTCEAALNFYKDVFGGEVTQLMRFDGMPTEADIPADYKHKIMHSNFKSPALKFMASDSPPGGRIPSTGTNVSLSLSTRDLDAAERIFDALGSGGQIIMPLRDAFWGARFGMVTDRYGIQWMLNAEKS